MSRLLKLLMLGSVLGVIGLGLWLHEGKRSVNFLKPWILRSVNAPEAPYLIDIGEVTVDWTNAAELGKLHIERVTASKRDGSVFAVLPDVYATIDPIGFLPTRRLMHKIILRQPHLSLVRTKEGSIEFGIEGAQARLPLKDVTAFMASSESESAEFKPTALPFHTFMIEKASLTFNDEISGTSILSNPFEFQLKRHGPGFDALVNMPLEVDEKNVRLTAGMRAMTKSNKHVIALSLTHVPGKLLCLFDTCPEGVSLAGPVDGSMAAAIAPDFTVHEFKINIATPKAVLHAPKYFAEPLKLSTSSLVIEGDVGIQAATVQAALSLEDTNIKANGKIHKDEKGWYVTGSGDCTRLDVTKIYKYWPLTMAPDSRTWVTSKLKSGYAEKGTMKVNLKPEDFEAAYFPDASIDAVADARDITFEYLPGFPHVEKMNGLAHFTATTVKVEGSGGTILSGTKINHAILWCPELHSPNNPMEVTLDISGPASDAANMLALKHFTFDDHIGLKPAALKGTIDTSMKLKFNAFSSSKSTNPDEIHLDAVDYDITATMKDVAQDDLFGGYQVRHVNGALKADAKGLRFDGALSLGDSAVNDVKLAQDSGKPLTADIKSRSGGEGKEQKPLNDFSLTYASGEIPAITIQGKRLDASTSYSNRKNSILKDFPAMKLNVDLAELVMDPHMPLREVSGTMFCNAARCESAKFTAKAGDSKVEGGISNAGGQRQFSVGADNAGDFLRALDITDRMSRGTLELRGNYDDSKQPPQLNGRLFVRDFNLQNSQILGRILSIASLTGIANALTGSGVSFDKFSANITSQGGIITIDKGIAKGASLGITVKGKVNTNTTGLDLNGSLAPAYALNSIIGNIPIIGTLAGGEGGLIAFSYWVTGTYDKPDVGVNPLSGLTPGFLRNIFNVFDSEGDSASDKLDRPKKPSSRQPNVQNPTSAVKKR